MDLQQKSDTDKQTNSSEYVVLARKYRPQNFNDLIGQQALIQTLKNALDKDRLAHAFVLTGVRGIGKTTTARIIAKGLNCIGEDEKGGPTLEPCGKCEHCISITEGRHLDVAEMDAASNTGVDNVREIIDSVRYQPVSGRYKIYIIDEVHMLSKAAFNALLKTLEEPPAHVKFIFATTEINKIPITVLSRCQRFDLRRVKIDELSAFFQQIIQKENATASDEAIKLIARAADGSVRDGLSILDQAIAHGSGDVTLDQVRQMLGLGDSSQSLDMLEALIAGDAEKSLTILNDAYILGAEPAVIIENLLTAIHWLTRLKVTPSMIDAEDSPNLDFEQSKNLADKITISLTATLWQILLKGLQDIKQAPNALAAAEMVCLRVMTAAEMPDLMDVVKLIEKFEDGDLQTEKKNLTPPSFPPAQIDSKPMEVPASVMAEVPLVQNLPIVNNIEDVLALLRKKQETLLAAELSNNFAVKHFEQQKIELVSTSVNSKHDFSKRLSAFLQKHTNDQWQIICLRDQSSEVSHQQQQKIQRQDQLKETQNGDIMQKVLEVFPDAKLIDMS